MRRIADEQADDHDDHGERHHGDLQPEAGPGVDHLAQLDGDEAAEAGARVDAGGVHADRCGEGGGAHAVAPASSGWIESVCVDGVLAPGVVSSKKRRSRPAPSAGARRRSSTRRPCRAGDDLGLGLDQPPIAVGRVGRRAGAVTRIEPGGRLPDDGPGLGQQLGAGALRLDPSAADDHHPVGDGLDLGQQVRGEQHGAAAVGEVAQHAPHPAHAFRIEAVGGLVEDQDLGVAEQCVGEPQALAHAERVLADTPPGRRLVEADELQQRVDALRRHAHGVGGDGERLAAAAPGVLGGRVEQDADASARASAGRGSARRGSVPWPLSGCERPTSIRIVVVLPAPLGPRKPVTVPGSQRNVTSQTTVRPPSCLVSPLVWIMPADSRPAGFATTVRGLRSPSPTAVADNDFGRGSRP